MENRPPIFSMTDPHYSDYGFDASFDFFQALQQARKHGKRDTRPLDGVRFKLKKPISKDNGHGKKVGKWWRGALFFWRRIRPLAAPPSSGVGGGGSPIYKADDSGGAWSWRARRRGMVKMPYVCLRELAAVDSSVAAPPLYFVS